jgi:hypothetical protein
MVNTSSVESSHISLWCTSFPNVQHRVWVECGFISLLLYGWRYPYTLVSRRSCWPSLNSVDVIKTVAYCAFIGFFAGMWGIELLWFNTLDGIRGRLFQCCLPAAYSCFIAWFTYRPWKWRRYIPPKRRRSSIDLHGLTTLFKSVFKYVFEGSPPLKGCRPNY